MASEFKFIKPISGDVLLGTADGIEYDEFLQTKITVRAPENSEILINGIKADNCGNNLYCAEIKPDFRLCI